MNILNCPFCGEPANGRYIDAEHWSQKLIQPNGTIGGYGFAVTCSNEDGCAAVGPVRITRTAAIEAWNHRVETGQRGAAPK